MTIGLRIILTSETTIYKSSFGPADNTDARKYQRLISSTLVIIEKGG